MINYKNLILNSLLDKYEKSKSLVNESNRRIILKADSIKEYDIEDYEAKNLFHDTVIDLKNRELVDFSWKPQEKRKYIK